MRLALAVALVVTSGCGNRCRDVEHAKAALTGHGTANRGADVRVTVPYDQANRVIAGLLAQEPITMELAPPAIRLFPVEVRPVAIVREAVLAQPLLGELPTDRAGTVRLATRFEIREGDTIITDVAAVIELRPVIVNNQLVIGFGPQDLVRVKPTLGPDAKQTLGKAVERWVPARLRSKIPKFALDAAAKQLGVELTETAWDALRGTLLKRLGDVTRVELRLPDVPIARHHIQSAPTGLVVELETTLPVRRGLAPTPAMIGTDVGVRISASAAAELANWAIDQGHGPTHFDRSLKPSTSGDYQPRFDYVAEDRQHPLKVYAFQQRGGCSYHRVGVRGAIALEGDTLKATVLDRDLEAQSANPVIELGAWTKYFFAGWVDRSKRVVAHTQLAVGNRALATRVTKAAIEADELVFELRLEAAPSSSGPSAPISTERPSPGSRRATSRTRC